MSGAPQPQVALVTGAASGIGRAVASALAGAGYRLALCDSDGPGLSSLSDELRERDAPAHASYRFDLRDGAAVREAVAASERQLGPLTALALVAGVLHMGSALSVSEQGFRDTFAVNVEGAFQLTRAVLPGMVQRRRGSVVAVASNAGRTPRIDMAAYGASKAALIMYMKCLGLEVAPYGVRCNVVSPGSTDTPMQRALWGGEDKAEQVIQGDLARSRLGIPLRRIAQPADIAHVVLYLLSERARHITMQDLCVDGGATL